MFQSLRQYLTGLSRSSKRAILILFDVVALLFVIWLSYSLRLGTRFVPDAAQVTLMVLAPAVAIPIYVRMGLYRSVIRYLPERAVWAIFWAVTMATLVWLAVLFLAEITRIAALPRSIPVLYWIFGLIVIAGSRFVAKAILWTPMRQRYRGRAVAIYGAGMAGRQLAVALRSHGDNYVAGFLDDDKSLHGRDVEGIRVYPSDQIGRLVDDFGVAEVILCIPSSASPNRRSIFERLSKRGVKVRSLPAISDLVSGKYLVSQLQEIDIDDLLGRSSVPSDPSLLRGVIADKVILVTGGGGSIGSELAKLIAKWGPRKLVVFEANEFALYQIDRYLREHSDIDLVPVLGSVDNAVLVRRVLQEHNVQVVFHAAAHKHVPLVEANAVEGVRNNVLGTHVIATTSLELGVEQFVLISTDKAVRPTNVMGATKRWAEFIVQDCARRAILTNRHQRFCSVRFGNVLGSNGSVVPLFKEQIGAGGPITLTDSRMTRYFMSIHEAAELIGQAAGLSGGGDVFLLEMGEPIRIQELAENMIRLAGLSLRTPQNPTGDIEITDIGLRPGEKLYEELFYDPGSVGRTEHPKILRAIGGDRAVGDIDDAMIELRLALTKQDEVEVRRILFDFIQE